MPTGHLHAVDPANGWTNGPFGTRNAREALVGGVVTLSGAIATSGTNSVAFTLPAADRPTTNVFVKVHLCNSHNGRLDIGPSGVVSVETEGGDFAQAQCFTSLDGVSFARSTSSFTALSLVNGWTNGPFGTANAAVRNYGGIVQLMGAIATSGTNPVPFTLPVADRPATDVYVPVDLCGASNGRLHITPKGVVDVEAETNFSNAQCFTSLDGVSFAANPVGSTALTLRNGWTNGPFSTSIAAAADVAGIVHFKGVIAGGTNPTVFTLPGAFRPTKAVYVPVDLCDAANGRLFIQPNGVVSVETKDNINFSDAQCFTSLDGASFAL